MAEYINKEKMLKYLEENNTADEWIVGQYNADWIYSFIESQPIADVVEVVTCKDCEHWDNGDCYKLELSLPNDFCSYGTPKERGRDK
jgi:hypothetical protein